MTGPVVETAQGRIEGVRKEGVSVFRGIPYAAPPVGGRRFRPPVEPDPWTGTRPATRFGPVAPQASWGLEQLLGAPGLEADEGSCLTLNVWTPEADAGRRPVMVWIHGGAFVFGTAATTWYDGSRFAARDVVLVGLNYRLGALGFLHLADVAGDGYEGSGLAGILDQVQALRWVRDNIAAFGGDPGNVTIFGESAGAMSVGTLLGLPEAEGLFHRAVLQSGACSHTVSREDADRVTHRLLDTLGLDRGRAGELPEVPVERLLEAQAGLVRVGAARRALAFRPVVDGPHLPDAPLRRVADGSARKVSIIAGTNLDEWNLFGIFDPDLGSADESTLLRLAAELLPGADAARVLEVYRASRPGAPPSAILSALSSDSVFRIPAVRLAEAQVAAGGEARMYLFSWPTPALGGTVGSCHALEIPFVFDTLDRPGAALFSGPEPPVALARTMNEAWAGFARHGEPAAPELPRWPLYDTDGRRTMVFNLTSRVEEDPMAAERRAWDPVVATVPGS